MIFDSEAQRQLLMALLKDVPVQTTLGDLFSEKGIGVNPEVAALVQAINEGEIVEVEEPEDDAS